MLWWGEDQSQVRELEWIREYMFGWINGWYISWKINIKGAEERRIVNVELQILIRQDEW